MSIDSNFINPQGNLLEVLKQIEMSTLQHSFEIQKDRVSEKYVGVRRMWPEFWCEENQNIRYMSFLTADGSLYHLENEEVFLYLTNRMHNPVLNNFEDAFNQIKEKKYYFPNAKAVELAINAESTLKIKLPVPNSFNDNKELELFSFYVYDFSDEKNDYSVPLHMTSSQRTIAKRINGEGEDYRKVMQMISMEGPFIFSFYSLNQNYVKKVLEDNNAVSLASGSVLSSMNFGANFYAYDKIPVDCNNLRLRGIPKEKTEIQDDARSGFFENLFSICRR